MEQGLKHLICLSSKGRAYFQEVKIELLNYQHLGMETFENGTLLIGRAPHVASQAWLIRTIYNKGMVN
jgi:hypothetical protein